MDLPWLFYRLRCMGPLEIAVRAQRMARDFIRYRFQDWPISRPGTFGRFS